MLAALALNVALAAGLAVAWSPRSWRIAVAIASISIATLLWALTARTVRLPLQTIPVALMGAWGFAQIFLRTSVVPHLTLRSSVTWAMCAIAFVLGSQIARSRRSRRSFLEAMLWVSTGLGALAMLQAYTSDGRVLWLFPADEGVLGTFYSRNQFAAFMEIGAPIALWQVMREKVALGGVCYAVMFAATLTSASRAGVILVSAELVVFLALMVFQHRMPLKSAASVVAILLVLVAGASAIAGTEQTLNKFQDPNLYGVRQPLVDSTLKMIAQRPWTGSGLGTWRAMYPGFATFDLAEIANEAHNDWLQWAAEGGVLFSLLLHAYVDFPLREPALAFLWFAMAGALTQVGRGTE
jgi:O-antigen ligase